MPSLAEIIDQTQQATEGDPQAGKVLVRVQGELAGEGMETTLRAGRHRIVADQPEAMGGEDKGTGPVDYALVALASCQAALYRFWAAKLGIELETLEVSVEGDLDVRGFLGFDDAVRPGFSEIRVQVAPGGPESADRYRELGEAVDAHCPVQDLFANATPVRVDVALPTL